VTPEMNPIEQIRAELRKRGFKMKCLIPLTKLLIAFVIPFAHLMFNDMLLKIPIHQKTYNFSDDKRNTD